MRRRRRGASGPPEAAPACTLPGLSNASNAGEASGHHRPAGRWAGAATLAGLLLLGACAASVPPPLTSVPGLCRLGPDDGPPLADRGIGGTGSPTAVADRGIGGTGTPMRIADRGIGGTGIVAIITGFASICLGGVEVALDPAVPITLNGQPSSAGALRAGQLAVVDAGGNGTALNARRVEIRQEVSGPVESVGTDGRLRVAGQPVQISATTLGERRPVVGQWVAVSGLRGPDGVVQATRLDLRAPGEVLVRGRAAAVAGNLRIGTLTLRPDQPSEASGFVTATGRYRAGVLTGAQLTPDPLAADPAAAFPATTRRILVESYAVAGQGGLRLGAGPPLPGIPGLGAAVPERAIVEFERRPGGGFHATGLRREGPGPAGGAAPVPGGIGEGAGRYPGQGLATGRGSQPAPVPRGMPRGEGGHGRGLPSGGAPPEGARMDRRLPPGGDPPGQPALAPPVAGGRGPPAPR